MKREFIEGLIKAAREEQDRLRISHARQEGAVALCEVILKKLSEDKEDEKK